MSGEAKGRWWEDYLVRYLTPMLVGAGLIFALIVVIGLDGNFSSLDTSVLWNSKKEANLAVVIGVLVAGFAYAYLCSTPITIFHAGRMIRAGLNLRATPFWYGWMLISFLAIVGLILDSTTGLRWRVVDQYRVHVLLFIASLPALWMLVGQYDVIWRLKQDKASDDGSEFLAFYTRLAVARGGTIWAKELRESYTHMREHANSVFICVAEISVAAAVVLLWKLTHSPVVFALIVLLSLLFWLLPNVFLWSIANKLEWHLAGETPEPLEPLRRKAREYGRGLEGSPPRTSENSHAPTQ